MAILLTIIMIVILLIIIFYANSNENHNNDELSILHKNENELIEKLKNWCNNNEVTYKENIVKENPSKVNGTYGYIWIDNKNIIFCPQPPNVPTAYVGINKNPTDIQQNIDNIIFIKYQNIKFYNKDGSVNYTNEVINEGKNISISGAIAGGVLGGEAGAIIGAKKDANNFKNITTTHDNTHCYIYYQDHNDVKLLNVEGIPFYNKILNAIPEKEYNYLQSIKSISY